MTAPGFDSNQGPFFRTSQVGHAGHPEPASRADQGAAVKSNWPTFFPPAQWLAEYRASWLRPDIIAGVTLAAYAIPVSLAYATLAGLPP